MMEALHPSHSGEDSGDGLAVLPRHTKVLVTGNNRTKSVLVGLQGVVTKAVGLGGWHWLMLTNGDEVKLQRNALSVIEAPSGHEEDGGDEDDNEVNPFSRETSLDKTYPRNSFRVHSRKPALPTSSNPGVMGNNNSTRARGDNRCLPVRLTTPLQQQQPQELGRGRRRENLNPRSKYRNDGRLPPRIDRMTLVIRRQQADETINHQCIGCRLSRQSVNLSKLETAILKRYRSHFQLVEVGPNSSKEQLVEAVVRHFMSQELDEGQVIMGFMQAAKRLRA